jgi:integrative and conjugative element protein (TIGR02256 family)
MGRRWTKPQGMPNVHAPVIRIRPAAVRTIKAEAPSSADGRETGGILLGHDPAPDGRIEVTTAGDPGPAANRQCDRFTRDLTHAQRLADEAYAHDGSVWLGEWHTHPTGPPTPSARDMATYRRLFGDDELAFERIVSLIVTPHPADGWHQPVLWSWLITPAAVDAAQVITTPPSRPRGPG